MSADPVEQILNQLRERGFTVEVGTRGYSIHIVATAPDGRVYEAVEADPLIAAQAVWDQTN